jgi:para-nitrobenzyl esterase
MIRDWQSGRRYFLSSMVVTGLGLSARLVRAEEGAIVATQAGKVRGLRRGHSCAFLGIPYGASTRGDARFLPAPSVKPWSGVRDAVSYGNAAPQLARLGSADATQDEDCLVVNVYTPSPDRAKRAVMVFIHGGGYGSGSGGARYDGQRLVERHDVVLVTLNHRLGVCGFLDLSQAGERYRDSANVGLLDIATALKWVRDNISEFGGDPGCVTIFGQSGGAGKVSNLLAMPGAAGLFHRAIPMSGAVLRSLTRAQSLELTHALTSKLGLGPDAVESLLALPAKTLVDAMMAIGSTGTPDSTRLNFGPVVDGRVLPQQPCDPEAPKWSADIPVMVGSTHDEARLFYLSEPGFAAMSDAQLRARLAPTMKTDATTVDAVIAAYAPLLSAATPADLFLEIVTQYMFARNSRVVAERKAALHRAPAYLYRFDWISPGPIGARIRAAHAVDIPLVLDLAGPNELVDDTPARAQMATAMSTIWTRFARTGNPNGAGIPAWPAYDSTRRATTILDTQYSVIDDPDPALREAAAVLPEFHP